MNLFENGNIEVEVGKTYTVGSNTIIFDGRILHFTAVGDMDAATVVESRKIINAFYGMVEHKIDSLIDLTRCGQVSTEARRLWKDQSEDERSGKVAFFGTHLVAMVIANFTISVSRNKQMCFFKTRDEALVWLRAGDRWDD